MMVEAWRTNKSRLYATIPQEMQLHMFLVYVGREIPTFDDLQQVTVDAVAKLSDIISTDA